MVYAELFVNSKNSACVFEFVDCSVVSTFFGDQFNVVFFL